MPMTSFFSWNPLPKTVILRYWSSNSVQKSFMGIMWENTAPGNKCSLIFCAEFGVVQLDIVLVLLFFYCIQNFLEIPQNFSKFLLKIHFETGTRIQPSTKKGLDILYDYFIWFTQIIPPTTKKVVKALLVGMSQVAKNIIIFCEGEH